MGQPLSLEWFKLIPILKSQGHNITADDLATSGVDLRRAETLRLVTKYIEPLMGLMEGLGEDEKVILVAHSLGGLAISKAIEIFHAKVHVAIFVPALLGPTSISLCFLKEYVSYYMLFTNTLYIHQNYAIIILIILV